METNIAKNLLNVEVKNFVSTLYSGKDWSKPQQTGFEELLLHAVSGSSTLQDCAIHGVRHEEQIASVHRRLRRNLDREEYNEAISDYIYGHGVSLLKDGITIAIDHTDFAHPFGSEESGYSKVWDGSRGIVAMGEKATGAFIVEPLSRNGYPITLDFHDKEHGNETDETIRMIDRISASAKEKNIRVMFAMDRGMDAEEIFKACWKNNQDFVIRLQHERDYLGDNSISLKEAMRQKRSIKESVHLRGKKLRVRISAAMGVLDENSPRVLIVYVEWKNDTSDPNDIANMLLITSVKEGFDFENHVSCFQVAGKAVQSYFERWGIETFFREIKQNFNIERIHIHNQYRRKNFVKFLLLGYVFVFHNLLQSSAYETLAGQVRRLLKDAAGAFTRNVTAFLFALRELLRYYVLPKQPGRHKKPKTEMEMQGTLPGFA